MEFLNCRIRQSHHQEVIGINDVHRNWHIIESRFGDDANFESDRLEFLNNHSQGSGIAHFAVVVATLRLSEEAGFQLENDVIAFDGTPATKSRFCFGNDGLRKEKSASFFCRALPNLLHHRFGSEIIQYGGGRGHKTRTTQEQKQHGCFRTDE
jgi:hypothetical protein